jgi:hypothetical protein
MTKEREYRTWQVVVRRTEAGALHVVRARRPKQKWLAAGELPVYVRRFLTLDEQQRMRVEDLEALKERVRGLTPLSGESPSEWRFEVDVWVPPSNEPKLPPRARGRNAIRSVEDLYAWADCEPTPWHLGRALYRGTDCGASISIYGSYQGKAAAVHSPGTALDFGWDASTHQHLGSLDIPDGLPDEFLAESFTVQTIVEGSEATVDSDHFYFGRCTTTQLKRWIADMEAEARFYWRRDNLSLYLVEDGSDEYYAEAGWGTVEWTPEVPPHVRAAFERWFNALDGEPEEGEVAQVGDLTVKRLDRGLEMF